MKNKQKEKKTEKPVVVQEKRKIFLLVTPPQGFMQILARIGFGPDGNEPWVAQSELSQQVIQTLRGASSFLKEEEKDSIIFIHLKWRCLSPQHQIVIHLDHDNKIVVNFRPLSRVKKFNLVSVPDWFLDIVLTEL